jgi:hypothetical protein
MKRYGIRCFALICAVGALAASKAVAENTSPSGDPFIGEFTGVYHLPGYPDFTASGTVVTEGAGLYRIIARYQGADGQTTQVEVHGHAEDPRVVGMGYSQAVLWLGEIRDDKLTLSHAERHYGGAFELKKIIRHSPTEGLAPPADAVVLLPYKEGQAPDISAWTNADWKPLPDGSMTVSQGKGANLTKKEFGDMRLHLEFNLPHVPTEIGQARGNSGVYVQHRYEIQVLDSFGVVATAGDCAALYELSAPRVNACLPPGQWQTYDILFRANRLNADGSVKEKARITVVQNGLVVQDNVELPKETPGGKDKPAAKDVLYLQDHGNPVHYRNIWAVELDGKEFSAANLVPKK